MVASERLFLIVFVCSHSFQEYFRLLECIHFNAIRIYNISQESTSPFHNYFLDYIA